MILPIYNWMMNYNSAAEQQAKMNSHLSAEKLWINLYSPF